MGDFVQAVCADRLQRVISELASIDMREVSRDSGVGTIGFFGRKRKSPTGFLRIWAWLPWAAWLFSLISVGALLAPVMHESDQASLVDGALQISRGIQPMVGADLYNYDKQFLSYWAMAAIVKALPGADPLLVTNAASFGIFWGALALLLLARPVRTGVQAAATSAVILAPAFWEHSAFLATNFLAGGVFFLAIAMWRSGRMAPRLFSALMLGCSVACRADMLLVLPLAAWLVLPRRGLRRWLGEPWLWVIAVAGVAAFAAGSLLAAEGSPNFYNPFFLPKIYAAYALFGLGAAGLVFLQWLAGAGLLAIARLSRRRGWAAMHCAAGGLALLPVFLFYSALMFSTRHWTAMLCGLLACCVSRRGAVLLGAGWGPAISWGALLLAVSSLFIGVRLPFPDKPSWVFASGTAFPTADGELSMGGYWHRLREMRASGFFHDHNQPVWLAARNAQLRPGLDGRVPVLGTAMNAYYKLAATMQGLEVDVLEPEAAGDREYYLDSRQLLRDSWTMGASRMDRGAALLPGRSFEAVSPSFSGIEMLLSLPHGEAPAWMLKREAIAAAFGGNSHRLLESPRDARAFPGHTLVLYHGSPRLDTPLVVFGGGESLQEFAKAPSPALMLVPARKVPAALDALTKLPGDVPQIQSAIGQLPAYMDIGSLR
jgi:hypothetical protein